MVVVVEASTFLGTVAMLVSAWTVVALLLAVFVGFRWISDDWDPATVGGHRIVVTGASSELGEEIAYQYCRLGARVLLAGRREDRLREVAHRCRTLGAAQAEVVTTDLFYRRGRSELIEETLSRLGGLDQLVLNHGAVRTLGWWMGTADNISSLIQDYHMVVFGFADLVSRALPALTESEGRVVVVTSPIGTSGAPGLAAFATARSALDGYFSSLRQESALKSKGVSVTSCYLGSVATTSNLRLLDGRLPASSVLPTDAARAVLRASMRRVRRLYYPWTEWLAVVLRTLFPNVVEDRFRKVAPRVQ